MSTLSRLLRVRLPFWIVIPMLLVAGAFGAAGGFVGARSNGMLCPLDGTTCAKFATFWNVWDLLARNYVDPKAIDPGKMVDGAIGGMVDSLGDSGHTRYLPPDVAQAERESLQGRFEGIGAYIDVRDGQPLIVQPIEQSPAERAGLKAGDLIVKVDGREVRGVTIDELRSLVRGPRGTRVTLTIQRPGEDTTRDITVERDEVRVPSVSWRLLSNGVAMVHLMQFSERADDELRQAITDARAQGATALVLDLRDNPGGLVDQLVKIAGEFLPKGTTVLIEQDRQGKQTPYTIGAAGTAQDIPMVVLVNGNSASSAEILAGALSEAGRAKVVGTATFGTATVLRSFKLDNGGELRVGTTQWLTPKGEQVRGKGIQPDVSVELPPSVESLSPADAAALDAQALSQTQDTQLRKALELLGALK
jgi:carboxyl-terminal processing protease